MMRAILLGLFFIAPSVVSAADVRVQTLDFAWRIGAVLGADANALSVRVDSEQQVIPWMEVLQIEAVAKPVSQEAPSTGTGFVVSYPVRGGIVSGQLVTSGAGDLTLQVSDGVTASAPLTAIAALQFQPRSLLSATLLAEFDKRRKARKPGRDILMLLRDDSVTAVPGTLIGLDATGWTFAFGGKDREGSFDSAVGVILGSPTPPEAASSAKFQLNNGDVWHGRVIGGDEKALQIEVPAFGTIGLEWTRLRRAELASERLVHLEQMVPVHAESRTVLGVEWPYQVNRNVAGGPLQIGTKKFDRGIGVHATHVMRFKLGRAFTRFAADVGVDFSVAPHGSCIFRVRADGKNLYETDLVRSGEPARRISVELDGVDELVLEVDAADELDLSDRANWCNPVLIRSAVD